MGREKEEEEEEEEGRTTMKNEIKTASDYAHLST